MKTAKKITLSAVMAALASVLMLVSYFPYLTYAVPAVSSLFIMVVIIEIGCNWAFLSYLSASVLAFLFAETESKLMFIGFFGFYPILKCLIEKINKPIVECILKFLVYNFCLIGVFLLIKKVFLVSSAQTDDIFKYGEIIVLVLANVMCVCYDYALSRLSVDYINRYHNSIARLFKDR